MDKKLVAAYNDQIKNELYSAYLYLSMSAYCDGEGLDGFGHWMKMQAQEETMHAMKMYAFLNDRGERIILQAIDQPESDFASVKEVFEKTLEHEKKVTSLINSLYSLSKEVNDAASEIFLNWFITEQVEEEKNAGDILSKLARIKPDSDAFFLLDQALAQRAQPASVFTEEA